MCSCLQDHLDGQMPVATKLEKKARAWLFGHEVLRFRVQGLLFEGLEFRGSRFGV